MRAQHTVVGSILLAADQLLGVEKLTVVAGADFIDRLCNFYQHPRSQLVPSTFRLTYRRIKVDEDRTRDIFAATGLGEEGLVGATVSDIVGKVLVIVTISLEAVLEQVPKLGGSVMSPCANVAKQEAVKNLQLPSSVTKLGTSLANVKVTDLIN